MGELNKDNKGFGVVELIMAIVIVILLGVVGWYVYKNHKTTAYTAISSKTTTTTKNPITTNDSSPTKTTTIVNPYAGWKTYNSILNSGLSFEYPANWVFTPATQAPTPNNLGGVENDSVVYSVEPATKPGNGEMIPTNEYMCVSFDEYSDNGWDTPSNWNLGTPIASQQVNINGQNLTLATYKSNVIVDGFSQQLQSSMGDEMVLFNPADTQYGDHFISTKNGHIVAITAQFNCQQGGFPADANLNADFNSQPETATAKLMMESIKF
ncbi:MAG TPA: hypothetical protein VMV24_01100 [Candidatus Dormibacteraeota bacterium]|nr:hypothetical protein [Candidatus Dormibacteraeota bacterium]